MRCLLLAWITLSIGCHSAPFRLLMRGDIDGDINGDVGVHGNVGIGGDLAFTGDLNTSVKADNTASPLQTVVVQPGVSDRSIAVIEVDGLLLNQNRGGFGSLTENPVALFREKLRRVEHDPNVVAVVLRIDSPGGCVTASDIMAADLKRFRENTGRPVIACLMTVGAGGGYYLATHSDEIIAHATSVVGGIGVILNLYNLEDTLGQYNIAAIPIKAGENIDAGTPVRTMEQAERDSLQSIADSFHDRFIAQVMSTRLGSTSTQQAWSNGKVFSGIEAKALGLVDDLGYLDDAISLASVKANLEADAQIIMLRRDNDRAFTELDITPTSSSMQSLLPLNIPGLDRTKLPTFMYLWQVEPQFVTR